MYYHLTQGTNSVELNNIASFDQPLPLCLIKYDDIGISIEGSIPNNLSMIVEYTNTIYNQEWISNFIDKGMTISRQVYLIYKQQVYIDNIKSTINYTNNLPHTGFIIQYNDNGDLLYIV